MMWDLREDRGRRPSTTAPLPSYAMPVPQGFPGPTSYPPMPQGMYSNPSLSSYYSQPYQPYVQPVVPHILSYPEAPVDSSGHHRGRRHSHSHSHHHSHSRSRSQSRNQGQSDIPAQKPVITRSLTPQPPVVPRGIGNKPSNHSQAFTQTPVHPGFVYSKCTGRKKGLCIGINYIGQKHELRGCINDAKNVRNNLMRHGYKPEDVVLLADDMPDARLIPTRANILNAMRWLVRSARPHDSLFFHYSGHGGQTPDLDGDEVDGLDEVIYPVDYKKSGHIVDDEMHSIMVKSLPTGCRLTALFDSCHSGTALDLPYIYSAHGRLKGSHVSQRAMNRKATSADVVSWAGCKDDETSADTFSGGLAVGAMSNAFMTTLKEHPGLSYSDLLREVRHKLYPKYNQKPQLGSSHPIDTHRPFII